MIPSLQLPLSFDAQSLAADLALVAAQDWVSHFNERVYGGDWRGVAPRPLSGETLQLSGHKAALMRRCSYFQKVPAPFASPAIREHIDSGVAFEDGEVRIHIPVQTSGDLRGQHRVANRGPESRVRLVIDAEGSEWAQALLARGEPEIPGGAEWIYFGMRPFSEPFFADIVRAALRNPFARAFRRVTRAWGQPRLGEARYFVKLNAWHVHTFALIRGAFPGTPWIFAYRDPVEILVSHPRAPGRLAFAGDARVLAGNYRQLPDAFRGSIARHQALNPSAEPLGRMRQGAKPDAKTRNRPFVPGSGNPHAEASAAVSDLAGKKRIQPVYSKLQTVIRHA